MQKQTTLWRTWGKKNGKEGHLLGYAFPECLRKEQLVTLSLQSLVSYNQTILLALCSSVYSKSFLNSGYMLGLSCSVITHVPSPLSNRGFPFPTDALGPHFSTLWPHHSPPPSVHASVHITAAPLSVLSLICLCMQRLRLCAPASLAPWRGYSITLQQKRREGRKRLMRQVPAKPSTMQTKGL